MGFYQSRRSLSISIISIILASFLIFVMAGNNRIKGYLNDLMLDATTSRPYSELKTILPNYFNYLENTAFWIEAGNYPELENLESKSTILNAKILGSLPGVIALNYIKDDQKITFTIDEETVLNEITELEKDERVILLEKNRSSESLNTYNENIFFTDFNKLESTGEPGFSIIMEIKSSPHISVSLDISLTRFALFYQKIFSENAILFSTFNSEDYITIPLNSDSIAKITSNFSNSNNENYLYYKELTRNVLKESNKNSTKPPFLTEYDGKEWVFMLYVLNDYEGTIGIILPESKLFFSQFNKLYIIASIPLFLLFGTLFSLFFISRYREKHKSSEEELILKLIEKGENQNLEFKSSLRWDYRENILNKKLEDVILKSIAAFANRLGGTLLIGVDDDGMPLDLLNDYNTLKHPDRDGFELHLRNLVSAMYGTFTIKNMDVKFVKVDGKDICKITVLQSQAPLFTSMRNKNNEKQEKFYIRDGNLSRRIESLKEITDYCKKRFK